MRLGPALSSIYCACIGNQSLSLAKARPLENKRIFMCLFNLFWPALYVYTTSTTTAILCCRETERYRDRVHITTAATLTKKQVLLLAYTLVEFYSHGRFFVFLKSTNVFSNVCEITGAMKSVTARVELNPFYWTFLGHFMAVLSWLDARELGKS